MKVSVIIPVYNGRSFVKRAINSVIEQSFKDWELIIVDDCSTDDTYEICKAFENDKIHVYRQAKNGGAGVARQTGLKYAKGDFVTFLDSDDYLKPDFLFATTTLQAQHNSDVVYTSFTIRYEKENVDKVIPAGDYIMSGSATVQLYYWNQLKFLTGKLIRRSLTSTITWSNRRVGEDCQTLYFLLYNAKAVRSSSYTGYIHVFRAGSLLADAPFFYCYCWSTLASIDILEFLQHKYWENPNDPDIRKLLDHEKTINLNNYLQIKDQVAAGKWEVGSNAAEWKRIQDWFEKNKRLFI